MSLRALLIVVLLLTARALPAATATLEGFASLPADSLMPGPDSGHFIEAGDDIELPFPGQPVQGFSAVISNNDDSYLVLTDNGFGSRVNSADFLLRIYHIEPDFRTALDGSGTISVQGYIDLADPDLHNQYRAVHAGEMPFATMTNPMPDESISENYRLTGADFDPESFQRAADGTFWVGDELGPFLLHLDAQGQLLDRPYLLNGLVSPDRPALSTRIVAHGRPIVDLAAPLMARSKGFEGMAMSPSGHTLYPMLEAALLAQPGQLNIYTFELDQAAFANASALEPSYRYRLEPQGTAIGAFQLFTETQGLVLERDSKQAEEARHKKIYRIDFESVDEQGFLVKQEVADLLNIADPHDLDKDGSSLFRFPFWTPECLLIVDIDTIGIINDNNYPFGLGRGTEHAPESTEFILINVGDLW